MDSRSVIAELTAIYDTAVERLRTDITDYVRTGTPPAPGQRHDGSYCYPELRVGFSGGGRAADRSRAFGRLHKPGVYATTVTRPELFANYLAEQLDLLIADYDVAIECRPSRQEIAFPYVLDGHYGAAMVGIQPTELARHFPATELALIGDELADSVDLGLHGDAMPLSLFDGLRTDFSLARLAHYTGTAPEHFQRFVLLTNYHRYIDEFVDWAGEQIGQGFYTCLSGAGGLKLDIRTDRARDHLSETTWRRHQMPAYHLMAPDRMGITLVNIGVGPANAKTITDHLAVLRPVAWLMIGHCGGLRPTQ